MNEQAVTEPILQEIMLWQDHAEYSEYYRAKLKMLQFPDGTWCIELNVGGRVVRMPYNYPVIDRS